MLSADALDAYDTLIDGLAESGQSYVRRMLGTWARDHPGYTVAEMREYAIGVLADACSTYGESCASVAADFYDEQAADAGARSAIVEGAADRDGAERVVRYKAQRLVAGDYDGFVSELCSYLDTNVRRTANLTTMANAKRDRRRAGERMRRAGVKGVRFARIPRGGETCTFCAMLASRGFVYWSEETAGKFDHFHNRCRCRVVASTDADVEGYDPTEWYARWKAYEQIDADESLTEVQKAARKKNWGKPEPVAASPAFLNRSTELFRRMEKVKPLDGYYDIRAHSDGRQLIYTDMDDGEGIPMSLADLVKALEDDPSYTGQPIRIVACEAGRYDNGLAQRVADRLCVDVLAPDSTVYVEKDGSLILSPTDDEYSRVVDGIIEATGQWKLFKPLGGDNDGSRADE